MPACFSESLYAACAQLLLFERSWMNRWKSSVLHEGEGNIRSVKWRSHLIAWANNMVRAALCLPTPGWSQKSRHGSRAVGKETVTPVSPNAGGTQCCAWEVEEVRLLLASMRYNPNTVWTWNKKPGAWRMSSPLNNGRAELGLSLGGQGLMTAALE